MIVFKWGSMDKLIDSKEALERLKQRLKRCPPRMLRIEEVHYILFGVKAPETALQRTRRLLRSAYLWVTDPFYAVYYRCSDLLTAYFGDPDRMISAEEAPPGTKPGALVISTDGLELFFRRNRKVIFHPLLGIEIATLELPIDEADRYRISPSDLQRYLKGEPAVEYETGSLNLLNSSGTLDQ